ncbi:MAG: phosphoribosylamine--glycine ligase [Acidobacteriota bacterium]|jgi:phosphoribosylamine--glycine ligase|nr:phosphoribosylamine--glycine ligase [Acidobacteriota bacterium]OQB58053.1 MAG: Phosphoribosylamine--glycine ligase [Candidatus Aminicenantes bacterium ADurb.Bin147]HNQ80738.1 phosphoribosylamine--glycine ligase [Candidatus Aminicenantes bacterium]MDD8009966.1 phosphoribosylamine--glycine ligase [Acidobacteriota bacterium]MDD8028584.1 phosphoribosylamine--glycine ligase [Acidobacteriota bacterium]
MKALVVGSGGREHALAWKIAKSPKISKVFCAPGNGGTRLVAENVPISETDIPALADFAVKEEIDLTVVGPEIPLSLGIVDEFEKRGLRIFGPSKKAVELEASKVFAKQFMDRHRIPTGKFRIADSPESARAVLAGGEFGFPVVLKADGLAAGKGVLVCRNEEEAEAGVKEIMVEKRFGGAGGRILIEEFLRGREVSFIVIADGAKAIPLVTTMDHKTVFDGGKGPNTGGMGSISPSPFLDRKMYARIMSTIILPTVTRMLEEGRKYKGALYAGLMLTADGPKVLEYNCRFGDPETQPQMLRLESDFVDLLMASIAEDILADEVTWNRRAAGCVVLASGGYPGSYEKGKTIQGLEDADRLGAVVFHAGTKFEKGRYRTEGGRVLGVCAAEPRLSETMNRIYRAVEKISFEGMHYRRDIGAFESAP